MAVGVYGKNRDGLRSATTVLVGINVVIFLLQTVSPRLELLFYQAGVLQTEEVLNGQAYRLLTSAFLHADINHLFSNMLMLYFLGIYVERALGSVSYTLLYLVSGVVGNLVTVFLQLQTGESWASLGASGAVFGVVGAYLVMAIRNRRYLSRGEFSRIAFGIFYSLYVGFSSVGTNNAAHIGGFLTGVVLSTLLFAAGRGR